MACWARPTSCTRQTQSRSRRCGITTQCACATTQRSAGRRVCGGGGGGGRCRWVCVEEQQRQQALAAGPPFLCAGALRARAAFADACPHRLPRPGLPGVWRHRGGQGRADMDRRDVWIRLWRRRVQHLAQVGGGLYAVPRLHAHAHPAQHTLRAHVAGGQLVRAARGGSLDTQALPCSAAWTRRAAWAAGAADCPPPGTHKVRPPLLPPPPPQSRSFDKHWYFAFDVHKCPPWNLDVPKPQEGIFPPPPHPRDFNSKVRWERRQRQQQRQQRQRWPGGFGARAAKLRGSGEDRDRGLHHTTQRSSTLVSPACHPTGLPARVPGPGGRVHNGVGQRSHLRLPPAQLPAFAAADRRVQQGAEGAPLGCAFFGGEGVNSAPHGAVLHTLIWEALQRGGELSAPWRCAPHNVPSIVAHRFATRGRHVSGPSPVPRHQSGPQVD